ncbi:F-box protein SKP2A [Canna indica]|uniref:F-box protein SKP2A n=1 Tax=Canna indica TaxID=4628 RepID=A0AAQ3L1Y5_9LILI|nr:F-box protein SKP2A [Canna indica]
MGGRNSETEDLEVCFRSLMVLGSRGRMEGSAVVMEGWKDLPMELLLRILSLLHDDRTVIVACSVCKGWRVALCLGLTSLSLSWCKNNMNNLVQSLVPKFARLQVLSLRQNFRLQLEDSAVETVSKYCHELRDLDLSRCRKLSDYSLLALAHGCPFLIRLNLSGCSGLSDSTLEYLVRCCKNLKYLNLCGCVKASDRALQAISYNCNGLQILNLGWCEGVSDNGVTSLAAGCPDLRSLDLCGCILITDESVIALANGCPRLRSLGLYYCQNITDRAMYSLANSRVNSKPCQVKKGDQSGLVNLNISQCTALTPPAVQAVCNSFPELHTCPERHSLIISGCLSLTSVHCACAIQANRTSRTALESHAY